MTLVLPAPSKSEESFRLVRTGNGASLHAVNPMSMRISIAYFLCYKIVHVDDLETSMPRKYLHSSKYLIADDLFKPCLSFTIP